MFRKKILLEGEIGNCLLRKFLSCFEKKATTCYDNVKRKTEQHQRQIKHIYFPFT